MLTFDLRNFSIEMFQLYGYFSLCSNNPLLTCALIIFSSLNCWYIVFVKIYNKILKYFKRFYYKRSKFSSEFHKWNMLKFMSTVYNHPTKPIWLICMDCLTKPLFLGRLRHERLTSNQMVGQ